MDKQIGCPHCGHEQFDVSESYVYVMECTEDKEGERELHNIKLVGSYAGGLDDIVCRRCEESVAEHFAGININWE